MRNAERLGIFARCLIQFRITKYYWIPTYWATRQLATLDFGKFFGVNVRLGGTALPACVVKEGTTVKSRSSNLSVLRDLNGHGMA